MKKPTIICMVAFLLGLMVGHAFAQPELKFDYEHGDGTPDDNGSMGVVFYNGTIKLDIYLANWTEGGTVVRPNVVNMDYYFTWGSTWLSLEDVTVITAEPWDQVHNLPTGDHEECFLGIADLIEGVGPGLGVGGDEIWSHTVELMGIVVPQTTITIGASLDDPAPRDRDGVILDADGNHWVKGDVLPATGIIHSICKEHSFKCSPEKPCDRWRAGYMCGDDITEPDPETDTWELIPDRSFDGTITPVFCPGEMVHVMHTRLATYPVNTVDPNVPATMCESECFNRDFDDDMVYTETSCNYHCMEEENTGFCRNDCVTITETIAANVAKAAECIDSLVGSQTYWNETCGLYFRNIPVTVRQVTANCTGNEMK